MESNEQIKEKNKMKNNEREFALGYNFLDLKNKKRLTKDLENLPSKELIKMINILTNSQNKCFKIFDIFENNKKLLKENIRLLEEKVRLLESINNKYEKYFDEFEDLFDVKKD